MCGDLSADTDGRTTHVEMEDSVVRRYPWDTHREISISAFLSTIPRSRAGLAVNLRGPTERDGALRQSELSFK